MSLKNYSTKFFNESYFHLLFKRYLPLAIIPLSVFFCLLFLFAVLQIEAEALILMLVPYAVAIVPLTPLILFKPYTKKGDGAYLTSIPLTRTQLFITTYLVGLVLIEVSLLIMSTITFVSYGYDILPSIFTFLALGMIYYSFACLGCMMGGHTLTQFMNMGVICFAPMGLYLLSKVSVSSLAFGNYVTPINDSLVMLVCPLFSAAEFLNNSHWPYFWAHILLVIGSLLLSLYLMKHRPIEQTGQGTLFKTMDQWLVKPLVYLNVVYSIFNICLYATLNQSHAFDTIYYLKVLVLLIGVALLVGSLMGIWTSKNLKSLFSIHEMIYQGALVLLAISFVFIPLWQNDKAREKSIQSLSSSDVYVYMDMPISYNTYGINLPKEDVLDYLETINEDRSMFISRFDYYSSYSEGNVAELVINGDQTYYFRLDNINDATLDFIEDIFVKTRLEGKQWADLFYNFDEASKNAALMINGAIYDIESIQKAIEATYQNHLTSSFFSNFNTNEDYWWMMNDVVSGLNDWGNLIGHYYPMTFSDMDYETWLQYVQNSATMIFNQEEWNEIENAVDLENATINSNYYNNIMKHATINSLDNSDFWQLESVSKTKIQAYTTLYIDVVSEYEDEQFTLFEGTQVGLELHFILENIDGKWQTTITEVYY